MMIFGNAVPVLGTAAVLLAVAAAFQLWRLSREGKRLFVLPPADEIPNSGCFSSAFCSLDWKIDGPDYMKFVTFWGET
jgi:hypothetical protein